MQLDIQIRHPCAEAHTNILIRAEDTSWRAQQGGSENGPKPAHLNSSFQRGLLRWSSDFHLEL